MIKNALLLTAAVVAAPAAAFAQVGDPNAPVATATITTPPPPPSSPGPLSMIGSGPEIFRQRTLGLSFGIPTGGFDGPEINLLYFLDNRSALDVILGFDLQTVDNGPTTFEFDVGLGYRIYKHHSARIHTFFEPALLVQDTHASESQDLSLSVAAAVGVECMFTDWFSVRGQAALSLTFTDKFKDIELGTTTTGLFANFYWN